MIGPKVFNRFKNVHDEIFPLSDSGSGLKQFNVEGLTKKNVSLLLTFPGVLACTLGATINQDRMANDLKKMDILKFEFGESDCCSEKDNTDLKIHENQRKLNEELSGVISNIFGKSNFLLLMSIAHFDDDDLEKLILLLFEYNMFCFALISYLETDQTQFDIPELGIDENLLNYVQGNLIAYHFVSISLNWLSIVNESTHFSDYDTSIYGDLDLHGVKNADEYLCSLLFNIIDEIIAIYDVVIEKFDNLPINIVNSVEKNIGGFNEFMEKVTKSETYFDIFKQYQNYFNAVYSLRRKINLIVIEEIIKDIEDTDGCHVPSEMKPLLLEAIEEIIAFGRILKDRKKSLELKNYSKRYDYLKKDEIINVKSTDDDEFIEYFESQKKQGRYKYLKYLDAQTLFYSDKEDNKEEIQFFTKNWKRDISRRLLPIIKLHIENNPSGFPMHGAILVDKLESNAD
ncbi:MAG: hypothetical protein PF503_11775 [Desulfobacula sp.]|jgi:hypothetical protein|nr:hypothetical protein [Desulfobacula sp.]